MAIVELVANSWDAWATRVDIVWPETGADTAFSISDNGRGMTAPQFEHRWETLDYNRLPDSLAAWMHRRHHVDGCRCVVEYRGRPVSSTKKAFANLVFELGPGDDVVRHSLRHTVATWGMQEGVDVWQLAGYLGMTVETLGRRYGHHGLDHMEDARNALGAGRCRKNAA